MEQTSTNVTNLKSLSLDVKLILRKIHFALRAVNEWNALSNDIIEVENINQFKSKLEEYWHDKEYKFDPSGFYDH